MVEKTHKPDHLLTPGRLFYGSAIVAFLEEALWDLRLPVILQLCATEFKWGLEVNKYKTFARSH